MKSWETHAFVLVTRKRQPHPPPPYTPHPPAQPPDPLPSPPQSPARHPPALSTSSTSSGTLMLATARSTVQGQRSPGGKKDTSSGDMQ